MLREISYFDSANPMRNRLLFICSIVIPLLLVIYMRPAAAADNGWLRGSCESGTGVYPWSDGNRYEGQCRANYFEGRGALILNNGDRFEGLFSNDQKNDRHC